MKNDFPNLHKIVILGSGGSGKSCITLRYVHGTFHNSYDPTIEDSYRKQVIGPDGRSTVVEIIDTAGQDEYSTLRDQFVRQGDSFLLVFSVTSSIKTLTSRLPSEVRSIIRTKNVRSVDDIPILLVGNKIDLLQKGDPLYIELKKIAELCALDIHFTSAKENIGIEMCFDKILFLAEQKGCFEMKNKKRKCVII